MTKHSHAAEVVAAFANEPVFTPVGRIVGSETVQSAPGSVTVWDAKVIEGVVDITDEGQLIKVHLFLNDQEIAATWGVPPATPGDKYGFRFNLEEIWHYVGPDDRLQVRSKEHLYPLWNHTDFFAPNNRGAKTSSMLLELLAEGRIFNQFGRLQLSKTADREWQQGILEFYDEMRGVFLSEFGFELVVNYGTHLGAVREGNFIGHDHDLDCGFILDASNSEEAGQDLRRVTLRLIELGYVINPRRVCLWVSRPDKPKLKLDIFHLYFDAEGKLCYPYGVVGDRPFTRKDFTGYVNLKLGDAVVRGVGDPVLLAEYIYGRNWRTPNPGFNWDKDRRDSAGGALSVQDNHALYWSNFYARHANNKASTFFDFVKSYQPAKVVVDIGCGDGRDSYAFGRAGKRVYGLDFSVVGVQRCAQRAAEMGLADAVTFTLCDVSKADQVTAALTEAVDYAASIDSPVTFYCRFFLHSIPEQAEKTLMAALSRVARPGDQFASEFRIIGDDKLKKAHGDHYRRYLDSEKFAKALKEQYGFDISVMQTGTGFSPYKGEDPVLTRLVSRKQGSIVVSDKEKAQMTVKIETSGKTAAPAAPAKPAPKYHNDDAVAIHKGGYRQFVGGIWEAAGNLQFGFLLKQGLKPTDRFIDVACGSLRGGRHYIDYLDAGNYFGVDKHIELIIYGVANELGIDQFKAKMPHFACTDAFEFNRLEGGGQFTFGIAQSLFSHLIASDIRLCMDRLSRSAAEGCRFFATFFESQTTFANPTQSHSAKGFRFTRAEMEAFGTEAGWKPNYIGNWGHQNGQMMIEYVRTAR